MIRAACLVLLAVAGGLGLPRARADQCGDYTFECLDPAFLKSAAVPAYAQHESTLSPANYEPGHGDFLAEFTSPSGKPVRIVVKAPVTSEVYDVPPIRPGESVYEYLNDALYASPNVPRHKTIVNFPKGTYSFDLPLYSWGQGRYKDLALQDAEVVTSALEHFRERPTPGFSDCLMLEIARKAGHLPLGTFDRDLAKVDGAQQLK
jgi:hypothetical protein